MSKLFHFKDSVLIEPSLQDSVKSDAGEMLRRDRKPRLEIDIDATHSGVITNYRVYPGIHVAKGYRSFISKDRGGTAEYDKPILKHHDIMDDPIGRIVGATFTPYKLGDHFDLDYLNPDKMGEKGSGVVTIKAVITDAESIQKIIDGRLLSVSSGHSSPIMLCSICGDSIMDCSHLPGKCYDEDGELVDNGAECYAITGPMTYHECSFVNLPAQPTAKLLNFVWKDSSSMDEIYSKPITSYSKGKKDMVRTFKLRDEDGELSLFSGKHLTANKKTVAAVSPAVADKLKHVMSSELSDTSVTPNVREENAEPDSGASNYVEQNLDKAKNSTNTSSEETNMDELEKMKEECQSLKDKLAEAETKAKDLEKKVEAKDSEIQRLTTDATELQAKVSHSLAVSLAGIRVRLKKPGTEGIDSKEKLAEYVEKLAQRAPNSLEDALTDALEELANAPEDKNITPVVDLTSKDKLNAPTLSKGAKPDSTKKKSSGSVKAIDELSKSFGLGE